MVKQNYKVFFNCFSSLREEGCVFCYQRENIKLKVVGGGGGIFYVYVMFR